VNLVIHVLLCFDLHLVLDLFLDEGPHVGGGHPGRLVAQQHMLVYDGVADVGHIELLPVHAQGLPVPQDAVVRFPLLAAKPVVHPRRFIRRMPQKVALDEAWVARVRDEDSE